jgi:hypothetical protein
LVRILSFGVLLLAVLVRCFSRCEVVLSLSELLFDQSLLLAT